MRWRLAAAALLLAGAAWAGPAGAQETETYRSEPVEDYRANRADCPEDSTPVLVAYQAVAARCAPDGMHFIARHGRYELTERVRAADRRVILVTQRDLADDSLRDMRHYVELAADEAGGPWRVNWVGVAWRCWPGRGHQEFAPQSCL